jgi:hypothetical protein
MIFRPVSGGKGKAGTDAHKQKIQRDFEKISHSTTGRTTAF